MLNYPNAVRNGTQSHKLRMRVNLRILCPISTAIRCQSYNLIRRFGRQLDKQWQLENKSTINRSNGVWAIVSVTIVAVFGDYSCRERRLWSPTIVASVDET